MNGFTKLFNSIVTSSIWEEDNETRIVWITMLAMADSEGKVIAALPRFAKLANISVNKCQQSLQKLSNPDPESRTPDNHGRRIEKIQGGWFILNYQMYREKGRNLERKEYLRRKKREERAKKADVNTLSTSVNNCQQCQPIAEAEAEAEAEAKNSISVRFDYKNRTLTGLTDKDYLQWTDAFPAVDIRQEIKSACQWLLDNPAKRKKYVRRFLTNWLRRCQERGGTKTKSTESIKERLERL